MRASKSVVKAESEAVPAEQKGELAPPKLTASIWAESLKAQNDIVRITAIEKLTELAKTPDIKGVIPQIARALSEATDLLSLKKLMTLIVALPSAQRQQLIPAIMQVLISENNDHLLLVSRMLRKCKDEFAVLATLIAGDAMTLGHEIRKELSETAKIIGQQYRGLSNIIKQSDKIMSEPETLDELDKIDLDPKKSPLALNKNGRYSPWHGFIPISFSEKILLEDKGPNPLDCIKFELFVACCDDNGLLKPCSLIESFPGQFSRIEQLRLFAILWYRGVEMLQKHVGDIPTENMGDNLTTVEALRPCRVALSSAISLVGANKEIQKIFKEGAIPLLDRSYVYMLDVETLAVILRLANMLNPDHYELSTGLALAAIIQCKEPEYRTSLLEALTYSELTFTQEQAEALLKEIDQCKKITNRDRVIAYELLLDSPTVYDFLFKALTPVIAVDLESEKAKAIIEFLDGQASLCNPKWQETRTKLKNLINPIPSTPTLNPNSSWKLNVL